MNPVLHTALGLFERTQRVAKKYAHLAGGVPRPSFGDIALDPARRVEELVPVPKILLRGPVAVDEVIDASLEIDREKIRVHVVEFLDGHAAMNWQSVCHVELLESLSIGH